ncbi:MAG: UDP-glucose lipid carrier transferase [Proteobacteria bacterium]|nr:UDP-glucose lipid carrier transferase [Pseudomonadota bacterium]
MPSGERRTRGLVRPYHAKLSALTRTIDSLIIYLSLWGLAEYLRDVWQLKYAWAAIAGVLLYQFFAEYNEVYYSWRGSPFIREALRIMTSWVMGAASLLVGLFFMHTADDFSRLTLGAWLIAAPTIIIVLHGARRQFLKLARSLGHNTRSVAIVGANELGARLYKAFEEMPWLGYVVKGFYDDRDSLAGRVNRDLSVVNNFAGLYEHARKGKIDIVYITLPMKAEDRIKEVLRKFADTTVSVYVVPDFFVFDLLHARWSVIQGIPVVSVYDSPFRSLDSLLKRAEDLLLACIILPLLALPMAGIAIGVRLSSPGPVFFKQRRYGIKGEEIAVWKFRTMTVCEDGDTVTQATRNDPRTTPFGAFLRRTSLDELPQFFNVLQGTMSVVGPRPHAVSHNEYYRSRIHGYMLRHKVLPGITGWAQVHGHRGETDTLEKMEQRVRYDLEYIRHWTPLLDLKIILKTIFLVVKGKNAF